MVSPVRFTAGVNTSVVTSTSSRGAIRNDHPLWNYPNPCHCRLFEAWEDFATYRAVDWTVTAVGAGTSSLSAGEGGILRLLTGAVLNNSVNIQHTSADHTFSSGNQFWYTTRINPQLASTPGYYFGLQNGGATDPTAATDGVYFTCAAGSANVNLVIRAASTSTTISAIGTLADATWSWWSYYYDGKSTLYYYKDNVLLGSTTTLTNLPTVDLAQNFYTINGAAATNYLDIDLYLASQDIVR
jgi:hypothetical protein